MTIVVNPQTAIVAANPQISGITVGNPITRDYIEDRDPYEGSYTITPTTETQILRTENLYMADDLTIEPIPSNYGLITWNGVTLTVS